MNLRLIGPDGRYDHDDEALVRLAVDRVAAGKLCLLVMTKEGPISWPP